MSWLARQFPVFTRLARRFRDNLSTGGKVLSLAICASALALPWAGANMVQLFWAMLSLWLATGMIGRWLRPRLAVQTRLPTSVMCGESFRVQVTMSNLSFRPAYGLHIRIMVPADSLVQIGEAVPVDVLQVNATARRSIELRPTRRGKFELPQMVIESGFPFNLWRLRQQLDSPHPLIVTPRFAPLRPGQSFDGPDGVRAGHVTGHVGSSDEFLANREYQPGLPIRRLDFKAWARLRRPVIREFADPQHAEAGLLIDVLVNGDPTTELNRSLEARISRAAAVADDWNRNGRQWAWMMTTRGDVLSGRILMHDGRRASLEFLALVQGARQNSSAEELLRQLERRGLTAASIVLVTDQSLGDWGQLARWLHARHRRLYLLDAWSLGSNDSAVVWNTPRIVKMDAKSE